MSTLGVIVLVIIGCSLLPLVLPVLAFICILPVAFIAALIPESKSSKWHPDNLKRRQK